MRKINKIGAIFLVSILLVTMLALTTTAAETYGYEVIIDPSPVAIGSEVTLTFQLTDYTNAKSGIRGFQIDIADVDDVLHEAVCTSLVTDTENLLSNTAKYQTSRDIVRHAYVKMSDTMSYEDSDLLEVKFTIPETYTKAGTLSLPLQILIQNEAGDKLTYTDTIEIDYALASEIPSEPDIDVVSVDVTWGAMEFTYTDGIWNAQSYTYEGFGWTDNGTGYVTVSNTGTAAATAAFTFASDREEISGSFTDGTNTITDSVDIAVDQSQTVYLQLSGKPVEELNNTKIGTVTVRIGGE